MIDTATANVAYFLTFLFLAYNVISDFRKMKIDARLNWMGAGMAILLIAAAPFGFLERFLMVFLSGLVTIPFKAIAAEGDIEAIAWVSLILLALQPIFFLVFILFLVAIISLFEFAFFAAKGGELPKLVRFPGFAFILAAFFSIFLYPL